MFALAEVQSRVRRAVVEKDREAALSLFEPAPDPALRLDIYQRHYDATLGSHLVGRFPTIAWLVGSAFMADAAIAFARRRVPEAPCLAEYGEAFPEFIASLPGAEDIPYLRSVGELDWRLGEVAVAVDRPAIAISALAELVPDTLPDLRLSLQPGTRFVESEWPVDDLVSLHLSDQAPDRFLFERLAVNLEVRGARGAFGIARLDRAVFLFRRSLAAGAPIDASVEAALAVDSGFDPAVALADLFAGGLVAAIAVAKPGEDDEPR